MSYIEQTRDWTEQERLEWVRTYKNIIDTPINNWIPEYAIDYKNKCCDNCEYLCIDIDESVVCSKDVTNDEYGEIIINSDTFYCSYHKLRLNNE